MPEPSQHLRNLKVTLSLLEGNAASDVAKEFALSRNRIANIVPNIMMKMFRLAKASDAIEVPPYHPPTAAVINGAYWSKWVKEQILIEEQKEVECEGAYNPDLHYRVLQAKSIEKLSERVHERLQDGWRPTGSIARIDGEYLQAMVFEESKIAKEFMLVEKSKASDFTLEVNRLLEEGWQLCGPMIVTSSPTQSHLYTQTMVKY